MTHAELIEAASALCDDLRDSGLQPFEAVFLLTNAMGFAIARSDNEFNEAARELMVTTIRKIVDDDDGEIVH